MFSYTETESIPFLKLGTTIINVNDIVSVTESKQSANAVISTRDGLKLTVTATIEQVWEALRPREVTV